MTKQTLNAGSAATFRSAANSNFTELYTADLLRLTQSVRIGIVGDSLLAPGSHWNFGHAAISRLPSAWIADNKAVGGAASSALVGQINTLNPNCNTVLLMEGVNDAVASVSTATHIVNITAACNAALALGMRPIVIAASPRDAASNSACILYALAERYYCEANGIQFFDPWSRYLDTDGTWVASVTSDGDHPLAATHQQLGIDLSTLIAANSTGYQLPRADAGTGMLGNTLQLDNPNGVGLPAGWNRFDLPAPPYTYTDWAYPGRGKKCTINLSQSLLAELYRSASGWAVGDRIRCTGMITLANMSNATCHVFVRPSGAPGSVDTNLCSTNVNQTDLFIAGELVVPTGCTDLQLWIDVYATLGGAYTCNLSFGAFDFYKIT